MGGFQFQKIQLEMVRLGVSTNEDDILPNRIDIDIMEKSRRGIPFRGDQEMQVSTLKALMHLYSCPSSLVVTMNSSTGMSS
jgi:hypothetical protein